MRRFRSSRLPSKGYPKQDRRDRSSKRRKPRRKRSHRLLRSLSNSYRMTRNEGKRRRIGKGTMLISYLQLLLMVKNHL